MNRMTKIKREKGIISGCLLWGIGVGGFLRFIYAPWIGASLVCQNLIVKQNRPIILKGVN